MQARAEEIARKLELHKAKLEAFFVVFQHVQGEKIVKEWGKSFIVMIAAGTVPDFEAEAFLQDITDIMTKTAQINELGRDVLALSNLAGTLASLQGMQPLLDVRPFEGMLQATRERLRATAAALRQPSTAATIAAAKENIAVEAERARLLAALCEHFQQAAVEAQKAPAVVWLS